jgi:hypothetical protein
MPTTLELLNELLVLHSRSLPTYLANAKPWAKRNDTRSLQVLQNIASDHRLMTDRIARVIMRQGGIPDMGEYPMLFTDMHDLSTDYVLKSVREFQMRDIKRIGEIVDALLDAPQALAVAQEALGAAKAHLDLLDELARPQLQVTS